MSKKQRKTLIRIVLSAVLLAVSVLLPAEGPLRLAVFLVPYAVIGWDVLWRAVRNIARGQVFDENFLMSVATIGAFFTGEYPEAVFVMLFYQVGELFQSYAVGKSRQSIASLMDIRPDYANLERNGALEEVDPEEVAVGDVIVVKAGEKIPLDGVVLEGASALDTAALTGEALPRDVAPGDDVISGCINQTGLLRVQVTKPFGQSTVAKILDLVENSSSKKARAEHFITKFARYYTPAVVFAALALAVIPSLVTGAWGEWIHRALIFLVISCPCALVISVPLSFFGGIGGASRAGILVKGSNYLEVLARTEVVVFDKTGTLTRGVFNVTAVHPEECPERRLLELAALAEFLDLPVSRTLAGQGCLSDQHPLMIGQTGFWGLEFTHSLTTNADVILGLGTRFGEADSSSWYQGVTFDPDKTTFLQIDIDPNEIGRNYAVEIGAIGDLKIGLAQILEEVKKICPEGKSNPELREQIAAAKAAFKASNEAISNDGRFPMTPQRILKDVKEVIPEDAIIFTDVGWNKNGVAQEFDITVPGTIHHSSGLATMGFGASAVLGGKLAAPDKIVLTLTGDGGFGVNPTCMATAVEKGIACTWVVMNNSAFGTIAGLENANYKTKFGTVFHTPDGESYSPCWADVAKAYGVDSIRCSTADEFKPALEKAIEANKAGKPFLVEAPMENIVVPTPGCWNINDIYSPNELVKEGKLVKKENGQYVAPSHSKSHNA